MERRYWRDGTRERRYWKRWNGGEKILERWNEGDMERGSRTRIIG